MDEERRDKRRRDEEIMDEEIRDEKIRRIGTPELPIAQPSMKPASIAQPSMKSASPIESLLNFIDKSTDKEIAEFIEHLLIREIDLDNVVNDIDKYIKSNFESLSWFKLYIFVRGHGNELEHCNMDSGSSVTSVFMSSSKGVVHSELISQAAEVSQSYRDEKNVTQVSQSARAVNEKITTDNINGFKSALEAFEFYKTAFEKLKGYFEELNQKIASRDKIGNDRLEIIKRFNQISTEFIRFFIKYEFKTPIIEHNNAITVEILKNAIQIIQATPDIVAHYRTVIEKKYERAKTSLGDINNSVKSCIGCKTENENAICCPSIKLSGLRGYHYMDHPLCYCIPKIMITDEPKQKIIEAMLLFLIKIDLKNKNFYLSPEYTTYESIVKIFYDIIKTKAQNYYTPICMAFDILFKDCAIGYLVRKLFNINDFPTIGDGALTEKVFVSLTPIVKIATNVTYLACLANVSGISDLKLSDPSTPRGKGGSKKLSICPYCRNRLRIIQWDLTTPDKIMAKNISWSQFFGKLRENKSIKKKHNKRGRKSKRRSA